MNAKDKQNKANEKPVLCPEQASESWARPPYELYQAGISNVRWWTRILDFFRERPSSEVIIILVILVLWRISELIVNKGDNLRTVVGLLAIAAMTFIIGLVTSFRIWKNGYEKNSEKTTQSGFETRGLQTNGSSAGGNKG